VGVTWHRTAFVDDVDATVTVRAKALNYGLGCFGGIRGYWSATHRELFVFRLRDHVERLVESARILGLESPLPATRIAEIVLDLLRRNARRADTYVRPIIYVDSDELSPTMTDVPVSLSVYCLPMGRYFAHESIHCCISSWRRVADNAIPARAKPTAAYLNSALARAEARRNGYDEAIFLTDAGDVSEGSAEHLFLFRRGQLVSPPSTADNLEGITRRSIIEIAQAAPLDLDFVERRISRTELYVADEVFLCGTGAEVTPVSRIDHRRIGDGKVGRVARTITERVHAVTRGADDRWAHWLEPVWRDARKPSARSPKAVRTTERRPSKPSASTPATTRRVRTSGSRRSETRAR
jgi:branched-chain amino acid aminotransferase